MDGSDAIDGAGGQMGACGAGVGPEACEPQRSAESGGRLRWAVGLREAMLPRSHTLPYHAVIIPSELGYGDRGSPPKIGGGDVLVFTMEILTIKGGKKPASRCDANSLSRTLRSAVRSRTASFR